MALHEYLRNRPACRLDGVGLNVKIIVVCLVLYVLGHTAWRYGFLPVVVRHHGFDVLATPVLLGGANLMTWFGPFRAMPFQRVVPALGLALFASFVWEFAAPYYTTATADGWDVVAYIAGAGLYLAIVRLVPRKL